MNVLVFGATGRVGAAVCEQALAAGHRVTAFVRDPARLKGAAAGLEVAVGDVYDPASVDAAVLRMPDAVVMAVGASALKASTLVTDTTRAIVDAMERRGVLRYLAVSGTAEMPSKTALGRLSTAILRRTPVGHWIRDHDRAYDLVTASRLTWTLAGCPYIKDGRRQGNYRVSETFTGGFKTIHPGDVADFLVRELSGNRYIRRNVGIWY